MSSATLHELLDMLDGGVLLLLPHARAARELRLAFDEQQRLRGRAAWEPAQALSWPQWTGSLWSELVVTGRESRLLLNAAQEHSLWQQIIAEDPANSSFASVDSLAELARSAWHLAAGYDAISKLRAFATTHDSRVFARWAAAFSERCAAGGYLSTALLDKALLEHVQAGTLGVPSTLELVGFCEMQPAQRALLEGLQANGTRVQELSLEASGEGKRLPVSAIAANEYEELTLAARWVRRLLEEHRSKGHAARVAVLLPKLDEERTALEGVLRETLAPELQSIHADLSSAPWEFSGGVALSTVTMIADALALLRWTQEPLPVERVSSLLLSPYLGRNGTDDEDRDASARFDATILRRTLLLRREIEIAALLELLDRSGQPQGPESRALLPWLRNVQEFLRRGGDRGRTRGFAEWMELVRGLLRAASWPGSRDQSASEFEMGRAWESTLDTVSTLDFSGRRVTFAGALQALELQLQRATFASPSTGAPVQVMNVMEAEGSIFDAVVFLRATDANWPAAERLHPLLSWPLQRSLKMPGADAALTTARHRAFTSDLLRRTESALFTYAAEDNNGRLRPSPLLGEMGIVCEDAARIVAPAEPVAPIAFEDDVDDEELPGLPSHEVGGGSSVLKLQARCGFLAFAELRLRATEPQGSDIGLDAGESGNMLHRTLQSFWKTVETQEALRAMSRADRDRNLAAAIDAALPRGLQVRDGWERAYLALQKQRLRSVLQQWLDQELQRGPFRVVDVERKELVSVGPLTLDVRVDRVDMVSGGIVLVDYKTGYDADPKRWEGPRPDDPQLPLYTLLAEAEELKGLAFAKVRAGREMKWLGYQAEEGILPTSRAKATVQDIALLVEQWRETLTRLAEDFAAGRAAVLPKSYEKNCPHCAQRLLCRVDPALLRSGVDDIDQETEEADG